MISTAPTSDAAPLPTGEASDIDRLLAAWGDATDRLQRTHETLREQVRRLSDELEVKNRELARKNRLADLGHFATHTAHEIRNSLMPVTLYTSLLRRRLSDDPDTISIVDKIDSGLTALDVTVNDLLHFAADRDPQCSQFFVRPLIAELTEAVAPQLSAQGVSVDLDISAELQLFADRDMVRRGVLNLMLNAIDAMSEGGELVITGCRCGESVELEIADSGPGLDEETLPKIFEPFYTTKSQGTGLGLAMVYRTAQLHGGDVSAMNCPEGGAAFTLRFPQRRMEAAA